jgi:hypothetical protein
LRRVKTGLGFAVADLEGQPGLDAVVDIVAFAGIKDQST